MDVSRSESGNRPGQEAEPAGLRSSLARYLDARGVLLSLEAQEAASHLGKIIIQAFVAIIAAFTGWLLVVSALVSALTHLLGCHWHTSALLVGGANVLLAVVLVFLIKNRLTSARWFADTVQEFKRDREWLTRPTKKN
ncbi:MAG: hypothetical protein RL693_1889 [Verrucomicrobiota bacterium]|jgi:hypothetical protein